MKKTFLRIDTRRALKDGTFPVQIAVGYGRNLYLPTGVSCRLEEWDASLESPYLGPKAKAVNGVLKAKLSAAVSLILELRETGRFDAMDNKKLREALTGESARRQRRRTEATLGPIFRRVISTHTGRTADIYAQTLRKLEAFCDVDATTFDAITRLWLEEFTAWLQVAPNTKSIHLRNLRAVVNYAIDEGITSNYAFRRFRIPHEDTPKRSVSVEVLRRIMDAEVPEWVAEYRDLFILSFCLIGINFVDLCHLKYIEDGRINYARAKTRRKYSIKVEPEAAAIIERYRGEDWLLRVMDTNTHYRHYYSNYVKGIRVLAEEVGVPGLSSYWARHTWATIARSIGVSVDDIALALGHGDGHDLTHIYIKEDLQRVDEANRRVLDYVFLGKK